MRSNGSKKSLYPQLRHSSEARGRLLLSLLNIEYFQLIEWIIMAEIFSYLIDQNETAEPDGLEIEKMEIV